MGRRDDGIKRGGVTWRVSVKENPTPKFALGSSNPRVVNVSPWLAIIKKAIWIIGDSFGECEWKGKYDDDGKMLAMSFKMPSGRAWLDGLVKMKKKDRRRAHKWMWNRDITTMDRFSKVLNSPWAGVTVEVWAEMDDSLPPEGEMTEEELSVIYAETEG